MSWFSTNKVLILGTVASIAVAIEQLVAAHPINWIVIAYTAFTAALSYLGTKLAGQALSIIGLLGTLGSTVFTEVSSGTFTWTQFIIQAIIAFGSVFGAAATTKTGQKVTLKALFSK